ncbi:MAG: hypothetical protein PHU91_04865 [Candidatus Omnitrophica bacterium]|nr:hypothetical protein [Candidatus Omnitrophota bacterium]MDD5236974.1 hypothetical protein [Candidatus Omnitrophota bacterium]MDD5610486.1 hypothetical protein [Candidatus Omnitrophota bacterium]
MIRKIFYLALIFTFCMFCRNSEAAPKYSSIKYNLTVSSKSLPEKTSSTYYKTADSLRIETVLRGKKSVTIARKGGPAYFYYPGENMALSLSLPAGVFYEEVDYLKVPGIKLVGQETVNGVFCDVYENDVSGAKTRVWINKETEFPVRVQVFDAAETTMDYSDVEMNIPLDNSLFVLPDGVKIMDAKNMAGTKEEMESPYGGR